MMLNSSFVNVSRKQPTDERPLLMWGAAQRFTPP